MPAIFQEQELRSEMDRANKIIAVCQSTPSCTFVASWLRGLVLRSEQALKDNDVVTCIACLKQIREVKG
jgi:hypothetical protein